MLKEYGPWALITGASEGIGYDCALILAKLGFKLVLVARRQPLLDKLASTLEMNYGTESLVLLADLAQVSERQKIAAVTEQLDIGLMIAAAGFGSSGKFVNKDLSNELNMVQVNCCAVLELCSIFAQRLKKRRRGSLVLFSSILGFQGSPHAATYGATKAFIQSFGEALHYELASDNIQVLIVAPGPVATGFARMAGMKPSFVADNSPTVAQNIIDSLGKVGTIRPGIVGKILSFSLLLFPRRLRVWLLSKVMLSKIDVDQTRDVDQ